MSTCMSCDGPIDRTIPNPIPDGYDLMASEALSGEAHYCTGCFNDMPGEDDA